MQIIILIGLPGSGKSTWARDFVRSCEEKRFVVINKDCFREMFNPSKYEFSTDLEDVVRLTSVDASVNSLISQMSIIIDETNLVAKKRLSKLDELLFWIDDLETLDCVHYVEFAEEDLSTLLKRRMTNDRGYNSQQWSKVIYDMRKIKETVSQEELDFLTKKDITFLHTVIT